MTKKEFKELGRYVRWVANEMGLRDWHLHIEQSTDVPEGGLEHDPEFEGIAACTVTPGQKSAVITFSPQFKDGTRPQQRAIVVHELVHCHLFDMREFVRTGTLEHMAPGTYKALGFGHDLAWENAVDGIARAWAEKMPLIKWPKAKK